MSADVVSFSIVRPTVTYLYARYVPALVNNAIVYSSLAGGFPRVFAPAVDTTVTAKKVTTS